MVMRLPAFVAPLFVPGDRPDRFAKAAQSGADAVIIDLEDAVPAEHKQAARDALTDLPAADIPLLVRVNPRKSDLHGEDLAALEGKAIAGVVLPKCDSAADVAGVSARLSLPVVAMVESVGALDALRDITQAPGCARIAFGSYDFAADLGCAPTDRALLFARSEIVLASRLAGLAPPLDGVTTNLDEMGETEEAARDALELGFGGKLAIHPKQIGPIFKGFAPSAAELAWARQVLAAPNDGAVRAGDIFVDAPVRQRAEAILARNGGKRPRTAKVDIPDRGQNPPVGFERKTFRVNGVPVFAFEGGDGPPFLFFHGGGTFHGVDFARDWTKTHHVMLPYHPGFGPTASGPGLGGMDAYVDHYETFLQMRGFDKVILGGISLGGWMAAEFALRHPEMVEKLVLVAPGGVFDSSVPVPNLGEVPPEEIFSYLAHDPSVFDPYLPKTEEEGEKFQAMLQGEGETVAKLAPNGPFRPGIETELGKLTMPTLLLWGTEDRTLPAALAPFWTRANPDIQLRLIEDAGHTLLDESAEARDAVAEFIR